LSTAILLLNFGEPENPVLEEVLPFLERIFRINDRLEGRTGEDARLRAVQLAERRAAALVEEYALIGGSPLRAQAREQAERLEAELTRRGHDVTCIVGMQFTEPFIIDAVKQARAAGATQIIALPVYPLCGPSTTVAALERLRADMRTQLWSAPIHEISGWHNHPAYIAFRAATIRSVLESAGLSFSDAGTRLVFSAHGTPIRYIDEGSRYEVYVRDHCASVARALGVDDYVIGYQNHTNRPIDWTQPDIDSVIAGIDAERVVVDAVSFMHEQSETLAELDHELRGVAESRGIAFHRVPIRHADPAFIAYLADLATPFLGRDDVDAAFGACRCRPGAHCLNAAIPS
jgi:ferrochelatase